MNPFTFVKTYRVFFIAQEKFNHKEQIFRKNGEFVTVNILGDPGAVSGGGGGVKV